jgi:hypothetical protein
MIIFTKIPEWVKREYPEARSMLEKNFHAFDGLADVEMTTAATTEGFSANERHVAQSMGAKPSSFTLKHLEFSGSPIRNLYSHWVSGIRDPRTNIATYPKKYGIPYAAANHTGELMYIVTRPDADNVESNIIEFAAYWTNIMPKKIPWGHLNFAKASQTVPVELDQPFAGIVNVSPDVDRAAKELLRNLTPYRFDNQGDYKVPTGIGS